MLLGSSARRVRVLRHRIRDYALYTVIAFAFVGMAFVIQGKWGHEAFIRWGGLAGFTSGLFGYFINESRQYLRSQTFWVLIALLLIVHLVAFVILLVYMEEWRLMWFMVMILEYPGFIYSRNHLPSCNRTSPK
jgi:hypothetical protein